MSFTPNRSLLNSKFEGYKFNPSSQQISTQRYDLPYRPTQTSPTSASAHLQPMSFQEVQSRIRHNHLSVAAADTTPLSVYVDSEHRVVAITLDRDTFQPSFTALYELPAVIQASEAVGVMRPEYASSAFIDPSILLVADGHGAMYVLSVKPDGNIQQATLLATYEFQSPSIPFRIHQCTQTSSTSAIIILSSKNYQAKAFIDPKTKSLPLFDIWGVKLSLPIQQSDSVRQMDVQWHRRGEETPVFTAYNDSNDSFLLFGGSPYTSSPPPIPSYTPTPDEIAPIPRRDENLDSSDNAPKAPPSYSWVQSTDSVTIAFPLPASTQKNDIKVAFTPRTLTVLVSGSEETAPAIPLPRYPTKPLWDAIRPSTSFWTWDREGEKSLGLLTLHIDKQHEGTRWLQVFASNTTNPELEVEETLDPSELYNIREALEKYTSSLLSGDANGLGLGSGIPSLVKGELDDELDASVGREVYMTRLSNNNNGEHSTTETETPILTLLSTPFPGLTNPLSLITKIGIDGLVYTLQPQPDTWVHTSTFPALAFVLASKQDTRFTHHISSKFVLAFESGSRGFGFNVYVYEAARTTATKWANQSVLRIGDSSTGPLLGLGAIKIQNENKIVILCLCERELVLIRDFPM